MGLWIIPVSAAIGGGATLLVIWVVLKVKGDI